MKNISKSLWKTRTGKIGYKLTNDYLFKVVFQEDKELLKALLSALLDIGISEITSVEVTNPIILGEVIDEKTIMLDINLILNDAEGINLEMQVVNDNNWNDRSIYYTSRMYANLASGEEYEKTKPVHHIGIVCFDVPDVTPAFYSQYKLMNTENHEIYSEKFKISVLNLKQLNKATENDKLRKLDVWAKVFKAETWDELNELSSEYEFVERIGDSMSQLTQEEKIKLNYWKIEANEKFKAAALKSAVKEAQEKGMSEGLSQGRLEGIVALNTLISKGLITLSDAAKSINMTEEEFLKAVK